MNGHRHLHISASSYHCEVYFCMSTFVNALYTVHCISVEKGIESYRKEGLLGTNYSHVDGLHVFFNY